jgi:maltose-binding protein MalE
MKKNNLLMLVAAMVIVAVAAVKVTNAETIKTESDSNPNHSMKRWVNNDESTKTEEGIKDERPVAWFVVNSKEARVQNKVCHNDPSIQSTPNCVNSLHALQIVFAGASGR